MCCHDYDSVYVHIRESPYGTYLIIRAIFKLDEYLIWYQLLRYVGYSCPKQNCLLCTHFLLVVFLCVHRPCQHKFP